VWFAGCHAGNLLFDQRHAVTRTQMICADIGGSAVSNDVEQSLSNITLRWMVREIIASGLGDMFDPSALAKINLVPEPKDLADALDPVHDEMRRHFLWWLLELFPMPYYFQDTNNVWHTNYM
jgi:hypothetical protein